MTPQQAAAVLRLSKPWTLESVKKAFKKRARETHPDLKGNDDDGAAFKEAKLALERLEKHLKGEDDDYPGFYANEPSAAPQEEEEAGSDLEVGSWFDVVGVRCANQVLDARFRAQLVQLKHKTLNRYGEAVQTRWLMAVYAQPGVKLDSELVEVVLQEKGATHPSIFVRKVVQRSYDVKNRVSAFWFDPLEEPVISEENIRDHRHYDYEPPRSYGGYYWWDVYTYANS